MKKIKKLMLSTLLALTVLGSVSSAGICHDGHYATCMRNCYAFAGKAFLAVADSCYENFQSGC